MVDQEEQFTDPHFFTLRMTNNIGRDIDMVIPPSLIEECRKNNSQITSVNVKFPQHNVAHHYRCTVGRAVKAENGKTYVKRFPGENHKIWSHEGMPKPDTAHFSTLTPDSDYRVQIPSSEYSSDNDRLQSVALRYYTKGDIENAKACANLQNNIIGTGKNKVKDERVIIPNMIQRSCGEDEEESVPNPFVVAFTGGIVRSLKDISFADEDTHPNAVNVVHENKTELEKDVYDHIVQETEAAWKKAVEEPNSQYVLSFRENLHPIVPSCTCEKCADHLHNAYTTKKNKNGEQVPSRATIIHPQVTLGYRKDMDTEHVYNQVVSAMHNFQPLTYEEEESAPVEEAAQESVPESSPVPNGVGGASAAPDTSAVDDADW